MTNVQMESFLIGLGDKVEGLVSRVGLLEIIAKKESKAQLEEQEEVRRVKPKKFTQINANRKTYLCSTERQRQIFTENNPGVETEVREVELTDEQAAPYLSDPENIKQFTEKETANA